MQNRANLSYGDGSKQPGYQQSFFETGFFCYQGIWISHMMAAKLFVFFFQNFPASPKSRSNIRRIERKHNNEYKSRPTLNRNFIYFAISY